MLRKVAEPLPLTPEEHEVLFGGLKACILFRDITKEEASAPAAADERWGSGGGVLPRGMACPVAAQGPAAAAAGVGEGQEEEEEEGESTRSRH